MGIGQVVNVQAMLTGNASSMQAAFAQGSASAKAFQAAYQQTATGVQMSSAQIQAAMAKEIAAAKANAIAAQQAATQATAARQLAAAQAVVAADREAVAHAKAAAAAKLASEAKIRADVLTSQSAQTNAAVQQAAAERAANTAALASQQKVAAAAKAAAAAEKEAVAISSAMRAEEGAMAASAHAAEYAAAQKQAAQQKTAAVYSKLAAGVTLAAAAVGVGAVMMAADFEASTLKLHTSGGMAMDDLAIVRDGILEIAQATGTGAKELADGMYDVVSGGYMGADALNILKAATQGAKAEGADLSIMAKGLTAVMASYHIPATEAVATTNALSAASGLAKGNLQEFTGSLSTVLPIAAAVGISFAEVAAATAIMTQHGKSADEATQELRNAILNLTKPNEVAAKLMQQLGIDALDVSNQLGTRGLGGTLNYLTGKILESSEGNQVLLGTFRESEAAGKAMQTMLASMPPQLKQWSQELMDGAITSNEYTRAVNTLDLEGEALGDQFLKLAKKSAGFSETIKKGGPETISYTGALATMMGGTTGLQVALDLTGGSADAFAEATKRVSDASREAGENVASNADIQGTVSAAWDRLTATVGVLAIQLGTVLLPAAQGIIEAFSATIKFFQENEGAAQALGLTVAALAAHIVVTTVATHAWAAAKAVAALASGGLTGAMAALNAMMAANPIGLVVLALAALTAGFIWAYNNVGWFKDGVDTAMKVVSEVMGGFFNWVTEEAIPGFIAGWEGMTKFVTDSVESFNRWKDETLGMFEDFNNNTKGMFEDFGKNTTETVQKWSDDTTGMFEDFNTNTQGMFDDFFKTFGEGWEGYWKDPIGETEKWNTSTTGMFNDWNTNTQGMFDDFFTNTGEGIKTWNDTTTADINKWTETTITDFNNWSDDVNETVNQWAEDTGKNIKTWNEEATANILAFVTGSDGHIDNFNRDTNATLDQWNKDASAEIDNFNTTTNGMFTDWKNNTEGMVKDWWTNTEGMFRDWSTNVQNGYEGWKNGLTGKTREFVETTETNIRNFNTTTQGMFDDFTSNTEGMFTDMWKHLENCWKFIQDAGKNAGDWMNTYVFNPINDAAHTMRRAFDYAAEGIKYAWEFLSNAAKVPVKFVVETIYTNGIRALWNPVATTFGLPQLPAAPSLGFADGGVAPKGYHTGGTIPGYSPGIDNQTIAVSGGEAIMRPEWTRAVGINNINEMNKMAKAGDGAGIKSALGSTAGAFADGGVFDPGALLGQINNGPKDGGEFGKAIIGLPIKLITSLVAMAGKAIADAAAAAAAAVGSVFTGGSGGLMNPLPSAYITQGFSSQHNGIDMAAPTGTVIRAAGAGLVNYAGWSAYGGGNEAHIKHANGLETWYAHMNGFGVSQGQSVVQGQYVGPVGSTGNSTGPHLHFMVLNGGWPNVMNPAPYIGLANGGVVPTFDNGGTLAPGLNLVRNATGAPEPLTRGGGDMARDIAAAITEALENARFEFDIDGISRYVAGRMVLNSQRRAGKG